MGASSGSESRSRSAVPHCPGTTVTSAAAAGTGQQNFRQKRLGKKRGSKGISSNGRTQGPAVPRRPVTSERTCACVRVRARRRVRGRCGRGGGFGVRMGCARGRGGSCASLCVRACVLGGSAPTRAATPRSRRSTRKGTGGRTASRPCLALRAAVLEGRRALGPSQAGRGARACSVAVCAGGGQLSRVAALLP